MDIRQFYITNANNDTMPLQGDSVNWFAANPENLGAKFTQSWYTTGTEFRSYNRSISNQDISFTMYYLGNNPYVSFSTFAKFLSYSPLTLVYQVPGDEAYRRSVSLTEIDKGEMDDTHPIMKGKLSFTPTSLWQKWEVAEQIVNNWDDSMSSKYYDDNHVAPTLYKAIYVYGNGSTYDYMYSDDATSDTKFYDGLTHLDHYEPYTENLGVQPNLLTGALGLSNDKNGITAKPEWTDTAALDSSIYNEFNKHIRDYDGKRLVLSCDVDLTFKDVDIPSAVSSIVMYVDQWAHITDGPDNWLVSTDDRKFYSVDITKNVKTGASCTVHLSYEFTMTPRISALGYFQPWLGTNPALDSSNKMVFDSHVYNAKLEVRRTDINQNLLPSAHGLSKDLNDISVTQTWTAMPVLDSSIYDDFNSHIRDYDGQRIVLSCDVDLSFKDVNIPPSVSLIWAYVDQYAYNADSSSRWLVPAGDYQFYNVYITKMVKTGGSCTVHLSYEFKMTPEISKLGYFQPWLFIDPKWVDGIKIVFDSHLYNARLEVISYNNAPKSNILSQKYTGPSNIAAGTGSLLWPNITRAPLFEVTNDYGEIHLYGVHGVGSDEYIKPGLYGENANGNETKVDGKFEKVSDTHYKYSLKDIRTNNTLMSDVTKYAFMVYKLNNSVNPVGAGFGLSSGNWGYDYAFIEAPSVPSTCMVPSYAESKDRTQYPDGFYDVLSDGDNPHTYLSDGSGGVNIGSEYDYIYQEDNHGEHPFVTVYNNSVYTGMAEEDSYAPIRVLFMATNKTGIINNPTFRCQSDNGEEFLTRINVAIPVGWTLEINTSYSGRAARMYERDNPSNQRSVMNSIDITETMFMKVPYGISTITNMTDSMGRTTDPTTFRVELLEERVVV